MFNKPLQYTIWTSSQTQLHSIPKAFSLVKTLNLLLKHRKLWSCQIGYMLIIFGHNDIMWFET